MQYIRLLSLWICSFISASSTISEQVVLRAVRGRDAVLPCGQGLVFLDGPDSYVLWMKENKEIVHRYPDEDSDRNIVFRNAEEDYGNECDRHTCQNPMSLKLKKVGDDDVGVYRCRVHYQASPAVDYVIELRLVESPGTLKIFTADRVDLTGEIGALRLGSNVTLICEVDKDQPGTLLWWERNGVVMERVESGQYGLMRSTVHIVNATRDELNAHYECLAQNADVTDPLSASVVFKMNLPPLSVDIRMNNNLDFEAGQPRVIDCVVVGCVPSPTITWHLGDVMLRPSVHKELHDGNFTVSSLTLAPSLRDDKQELVCRAHNSHLPKQIFQSVVVLNVGFRPTCLNDHEEVIGYMSDQTETVKCTVEAYPEPLQFSWTFANTKTLYTSVQKVPGYRHRYTSSLTWKPQGKDEGELLCRATNILGEQKKPCVYSIVSGGPPMTPNCDFKATYDKTFKISCKKSWDGGRPQIIHLELQNFNGNTLSNITDKYGHFSLKQIQEMNLSAVIYASNSRGRSDAQVLTLSPVESTTINITGTEEPPAEEMSIWYAAVIGTMAGVILICILFKCVRLIENRQRSRAKQPAVENDVTASINSSDGTFHREPELHMITEEHGRHVTFRIPACGNEYSLTPRPSLRKAGKLLGLVQSPSPPQDPMNFTFPEVSDRASYCV